MIRLIFLDFDGVVNSAEYMARIKERWSFSNMADMIDEDKIILLNKIIKETNAKVVISSTWRLHHNKETLEKWLKSKGFVGEIIGMTPEPFEIPKTRKHVNYGWSQRGDEIQKWLDNTDEEIESFIILDDNSDMVHLKKCLIQTTWQYGLEVIHVEKAIKILNGVE